MDSHEYKDSKENTQNKENTMGKHAVDFTKPKPRNSKKPKPGASFHMKEVNKQQFSMKDVSETFNVQNCTEEFFGMNQAQEIARKATSAYLLGSTSSAKELIFGIRVARSLSGQFHKFAKKPLSIMGAASIVTDDIFDEDEFFRMDRVVALSSMFRNAGMKELHDALILNEIALEVPIDETRSLERFWAHSQGL